MEQKSPQSPQRSPPGAPQKRSRPGENQENLPTTPVLPQPAESPFDFNTPAIDTPATPTPSKAQKVFMSMVKKKSAQIKIRCTESPSTSPTPTKKPAARKTQAPQSYRFKSPYKSATQALLYTLRTFRESNKTKWEQLLELAEILLRLASLLQQEYAKKITPEQIKKLKKLYAVLYVFIEENKVIGKRRATEVSEQQFRKNTEAFYLKLRFNEEQFDFLIKLRALIQTPAPWFDPQSPMRDNLTVVTLQKQQTHELLKLLREMPENFGVYFSALLLERIQHCDNLMEAVSRITENLKIESKNLASEITKTKNLLETAEATQEISTLEETLRKLNIATTKITLIYEALTYGENSIEDLVPQIKSVFQNFKHSLKLNTDALSKQFNALLNNGDDVIIPDEKPTPHTPPRESADPVEYNSAAKKLVQELNAFANQMELMEDQEDEREAVVTPSNLAEYPNAPVVMDLYEDLRQQRELLINYMRGLDVNTVEYQRADEQIANIERVIVSALEIQKKGREFINGLGKKETSPAKSQTPSPFKIHSSEFTFRSPPTPKTITPVRKKGRIAPPTALVEEAPAQEEALLSFSPPRLILVESAHASPAQASSAQKPGKRGRDLSLSFLSLLFEQAEHEDPRYEILEVQGDGDCGYTGFGITREDAYRLLSNNTHVPEVQALLQLAMNEANLNRGFQNYVADQDEGIDFDDAIAVAQAFINFDLIYKGIEGGWPHPAVLFALAHIQNIGIRIWRRSPNGELIPNRADDNYDFFEHIPAGTTEVIELLYRGNNHFDRLDIQPEYLATLLVIHANASQPSAKKLRAEEDGAEEESITPTQRVEIQPSEEKSPQTFFFKKPLDIIQEQFNKLDSRLLEMIKNAHDYYEKHGVAPEDFGNNVQTIIHDLNNLLEKIPNDANRMQQIVRDQIDLILTLIKDVNELTAEEQIKQLYQLLCTTEETMKVVPARPASPTKGT